MLWSGITKISLKWHGLNRRERRHRKSWSATTKSIEKRRFEAGLILKRVKAKLAFARFAVTSARNSGLKSGLFQGFLSLAEKI
jgi:hypothetical protein